MLPGGVRRTIIPSPLAYKTLALPLPGLQFQECGGGVGPIPPQVRRDCSCPRARVAGLASEARLVLHAR